MPERSDVTVLDYLEQRRSELSEEELATVREGIRLLLGLDELGDPIAVPLHFLDWHDWTFTQDDTGRTIKVQAAELQEAAVFPDHEGRLSLARKGDILLTDDAGQYALLRKGGS